MVCLERLTEAADPERGAEVAAIAMEAGMAILCIISGSLTITKAKLDVNIPKKRSGGPSQHGKALERFYSQVLSIFVCIFTYYGVECVKREREKALQCINWLCMPQLLYL